jgi:hypothetical protein
MAAKTHPDSKRVYTLEAAAESLSISIRALQYIIAKGDIIPRYYGRKPLIPASELDAWVDRLPQEPQGS